MAGKMVTVSSKKKILVIGGGSIGRRHASNLVELGAEVSIYDVNHTHLKNVCEGTSWTPVYDLAAALENNPYIAAIICTPNNLHIPYAKKAADAGLSIFIEKPLSHNLHGVAGLIKSVRNNGLIGMAGFMLRYEPGLRYLKNTLDISQVAFARIESASHMPLWHPESDYRKGYSSNRSMGGGIILDDVHEIDYACWLFGFPKFISCTYGKFSNFEIDVEDTVDIQFLYPKRMVTLHADYLQRRYNRNCKVCLKDGSTIEWVFGKAVTEYTGEHGEHEKIFDYSGDFTINSMYLQEMRDFLQSLDYQKDPESDLLNAEKILKIALKAKRGVHPQ